MSTPMILNCIMLSSDNESAYETISIIFSNNSYFERLLRIKIQINNAEFSSAEKELRTIILEVEDTGEMEIKLSALLLQAYIYWRKGLQSSVKQILDFTWDQFKQLSSKNEMVNDWILSIYYNLQGNYHYDMSDDSDIIFSSYLSALNIQRKYHNKQEIAKSLNNLGIAYYRMGRLELALAYYKDSLKEFQSLNFNSNISACLLNIGEIYLKKGQLTLALNYFEESLREVEKKRDLRAWAIRYIYISKIYILWGDYNIALEYLSLASTVFTDLNNEHQLAIINSQFGKVYLFLEEFELAKSYFAKSLTYLLNQTSNDYELSETICDLIYLNRQINEIKVADRYYELLQKISSDSTNPHVKIRADLASVIIKKNHGRLSSLVSSLDQLEKLISTKSVDFFITYDGLVKYTEILMKELEILDNSALLPVIGSLIDQIQTFGEKEGAVAYYIASQCLKSRLEWIKGRKETALDLLTKVKKYATKKQLNHEISKIDKLFLEYEEASNKISVDNNSISLLERLNQVKILDYLESINKISKSSS